VPFVRLWHKASFRGTAANGRYWGKSGHRELKRGAGAKARPDTYASANIK